MEKFGNAVKIFLYDDESEHLGIVQNWLGETIQIHDDLLGDDYVLPPDDWFVILNDEFGRSQADRLRKGCLTYAGRSPNGECLFRIRCLSPAILQTE